MTRALSAEQLLAVADEFCPAYRVQVRSFAALVACASVPGARLHGVPVCGSAREAAGELAGAIRRLRPLSDANDAFAGVAREVYLRWAEG